ncbi:MAG: ATP-binding cassette domain-containing protein [Lachnospiraceae bacterium]|nr:ATP-binding cassette domain-containing protein [Lachnospiraceae bacterium]MBD5481502.1 ATP-binding cassette domain-containing protein [Lachnospiraceae bacterium]
MQYCLELINITKSYKKKLALDHFSYRFEAGIYGLLGPNGAGKSTLMNIITQNLRSDEGSILLNGVEARKLKQHYISHIGYMPQQQSLYENLTLMRFMYYIAALKGMKKKEADAQIERLLNDVGLWEERSRYMGGFSGGMKQRALVAQALLGEPDIIILDEPTAGLDPIQRAGVREMIKALAQERIVIVSTHVIADIEAIAKEILMLRQGKLLEKQSIETGRLNGESLEELYIRLFG